MGDVGDCGQAGATVPISPGQEQHALELWRLEVALARARHERDVAQWRDRNLRSRRAWRVFEALVTAVRSPRKLLSLPLTIQRVLRDRQEAPREPPPLELPARPAPVRPSPAPAVARARAALEGGRHGQALAAAEEALEIAPGDVRALEVAWRAHDALGNVTRALEVVRQQRAVLDRSWLRTAERRLQGTLIGLDPRWAPLVAPFDGMKDGPVLIVQVGGDLDEVAPARSMVIMPPGERELGGRPPCDGLPLDSATQDLAWWAARSARDHHPCAVAARLAHDLGPPIAALAVARAGNVPFLLIEANDHPGADEAQGERGGLVRERAAQLRVEAEAVVDGTAALMAAVDPGAQ